MLDLQAIGDFKMFAHWIGRAIEVAGICVIVAGGIVATAIFLKQLRSGFDEAYRCYRKHLGRSILLGLEFLVAADIIGTVAVEPTFGNVGVLAAIVLIRTFLSFALELEIEGHLPWQKAQRT